MTPLGPPKRAPKEVPPEAALYLDNAAEYLTELVKEFGLDLRPYDQYQPDQVSWQHGLYGEANEREFCVQLATDAQMAPTFVGILRGWVRLYPADRTNEWLLLEVRRVAGMAALVTVAADVTRALKLACVWRMPHKTDPAPNA